MSAKQKKYAEEVYSPQIIPDKTEEIIELARKVRIREHREFERVRSQREKQKSDRINSSTTDKYLHALNLIIEHAEAAYSPKNIENNNDPTRVSIRYYLFNFLDHIKDRDLLESFFYKLKDAGCLVGFSRFPQLNDTYFSFSGLDIKQLKKYKQKFLKELQIENGPSLTQPFRLPKKRGEKELASLRKILKLTPKQNKLLEILFDFEPHSIDEILICKSRSALIELRSQLNKKLVAKTDWYIKLIGDSLNPPVCYQLGRF